MAGELMANNEYDLVVIGSGPAGEKGAAQAAYFGKKVALVEREPVMGGAAANTGTLPSKTLRETAVTLSGFRSYPRSARCKYMRLDTQFVRENLRQIPIEPGERLLLRVKPTF